MVDLRVLHLLWDGHSGGTQRYVDGVLQSDAWPDSVSQEVGIFAAEGAQINQKSPYPVTALGLSSGFQLGKARGLEVVVQRFDPQVIHLHCDTPAFLLQARRYANIRVVYTEHGDSLVRERRSRAQSMIWRYAHKHIDQVLANSEFGRARFVDQYPYFNSRSSMLNNPLLETPPQRPARRPGPFRIGAMGRLESVKGFDVFVDALVQLGREDVSATRDVPLALDVTIYGQGSERERLELAAEGLVAIGIQVSFPGYTKDPFAALADQDLVVIPSRREAFGLVAIEAQSVGTPVIASDVDGLSERVEKGKTGWLVPPEDPEALAQFIRLVASDPARATEVGAYARERVLRDYPLDTHIDTLLSHYTG